MLLARNGELQRSQFALPRVGQALLAEMIGTTRSRVNIFMTKFRKLGFIEYNANGALKINRALLGVVRHD